MAAKTIIASDALEVRLITLVILLDLYQKATCTTQRDHVKRAPKARYLHGQLWGRQLIFEAIRNEKGQLELIDGYTRCECLMRGLSTIGPKQQIVLIVHEADTIGQIKALYDQCDNPSAAKKAPDRLDEGLRLTRTMGKFTSQLMAKGPRASAIKQAAGGRAVRDSVEMVIDGMKFVDSLGLARTIETTSLLALYVVIGQHAARFEEAEEFIRIMNRTVYEPREMNRYTLAVKQFHDLYLLKRLQKSLSGAPNNDAVLQHGMGAFMMYLSRNHSIKADGVIGSPVTLGQFISAMAATK